MNAKHLMWIIPLALLTGLAFGFASSVYIEVPEKVTIEMGYEPNTLRVLEEQCLLQNITLPEPETIQFKGVSQ